MVLCQASQAPSVNNRGVILPVKINESSVQKLHSVASFSHIICYNNHFHLITLSENKMPVCVEVRCNSHEILFKRIFLSASLQASLQFIHAQRIRHLLVRRFKWIPNNPAFGSLNHCSTNQYFWPGALLLFILK